MKLLVATAVMASVVAGGTAFAHHSFQPNYVMDRTVTIEGTLAEFVVQNPHSFVYVDSRDAKGQTRRWAVEWASSGVLGRDGISTKTLKAGDKIVVTGNPTRDPLNLRLRVTTISRPADGWKWVDHH